MNIRKRLDALVNNLFNGNVTIIGEWSTVCHVAREGIGKAKPAADDGNLAKR